MTPTSRRLRLPLVVAALALTALVAACGADSDSSTSSSDDASRSSSGSAAAPGLSSDTDVAAAPEQAADAAEDGTDRSAGGAQGGVAVEGAKAVISTGNVSLRAADVGALLFEVQKAVDQFRGDVSERTSQSDDEGQVTTSRLVLRVPSESFGDLMGALERTGTLITSDSSSEDVTSQVIDNRVRVSVQKASIARIQALLAQAADLEDIVSIESELSTREAELNSLEQTQAYLADQTSMSTITVSLERTAAPERTAPPEHDDAGFVTGLSAGWDALSGFATVAATVAGALLPWLVLVGVFAVPGVALARRLRRRTTGAATT